ncbi:MAG: glucose 1-dehydrogenase [Chromatiales bacterium]|nr:glucose 1-dehydrogenase [Chromatiales bacterium]
MRLEKKVALITGAAAGLPDGLMGFGGASAWRFVREGAKVVLTDINQALGERSAQAIRDEGGDAIFFNLDVTSAVAWDGVIASTLSKYGRLDVMVNNAGTAAPANLENTTEDIWDQQMDVHAKGVFLGTKAAIAPMRDVGGGSIVNISSIYGIIGSPTSTAYHAAKGAIRTFSKAAAVQHAAENIRVNSVHPGYAVTPLTDESFAHPARQQWLLDRIPMGRLGTADDLVGGILFLASDESRYMTGAELVIDGGVTAQ